MIIETLDWFLSGNWLRWIIRVLKHPIVIATLFYMIGYFNGKY